MYLFWRQIAKICTRRKIQLYGIYLLLCIKWLPKPCLADRILHRSTNLEINDKVLCLHVLHNVLLLMFQNGTAEVYLIVNPHYNAETDILTNLCPVQVVPETLLQPMEANLKVKQLISCDVNIWVKRSVLHIHVSWINLFSQHILCRNK